MESEGHLVVEGRSVSKPSQVVEHFVLRQEQLRPTRLGSRQLCGFYVIHSQTVKELVVLYLQVKCFFSPIAAIFVGHKP
jgi:hypothetical protein